MNKTDIQKGKMVYYARMLKPVGIYEVCDLYVRTVRDDYFVGTDKRDKHAYLFSYNKLDKTIFKDKTRVFRYCLRSRKERP